MAFVDDIILVFIETADIIIWKPVDEVLSDPRVGAFFELEPTFIVLFFDVIPVDASTLC